MTLAFSGGLVEWNLRIRVTSTRIPGLARGLPARCLAEDGTDATGPHLQILL
jgi:hypothetical protein